MDNVTSSHHVRVDIFGFVQEVMVFISVGNCFYICLIWPEGIDLAVDTRQIIHNTL